MSTDSRRLLAGLEEYHRKLIRQKATFTSELTNARSCWSRLSEVYQGTAADQFRNAWECTYRNLSEYLSAVERLEPILRDRIEALREADRAVGGLP